jgi:uncharacterized protein (UPF0335 family)
MPARELYEAAQAELAAAIDAVAAINREGEELNRQLEKYEKAAKAEGADQKALRSVRIPLTAKLKAFHKKRSNADIRYNAAVIKMDKAYKAYCAGLEAVA